MGIIQLPTPLVGQGGLLPAQKLMVSSDNLATVTAAGYLNNVNLEGYPIAQSDVIQLLYNYVQETGVGTYGVFVISIANGVITLSEAVEPGGVTVIGSVTAGHFATWAGAESIQDGGVKGTASSRAASDVTKASVASVNGATVVGHVATFSDISGTIQDGGALGQAASKAVSDNTKASVASINGSTVVGHVATFSDVSGTIQDGGALGQAASKAVSNNADPSVASVSGATVVGHVATFADVSGTVQDGGALGQAASKAVSDNTKPSVASVTTPTVAYNILRADDAAGTIADTGIAVANVQLVAGIKAGQATVDGTISPGPFIISVAGLTGSSIVVAVPASEDNDAFIDDISVGIGSFSITFNTAPGAATLVNYIAFVAPQ